MSGTGRGCRGLWITALVLGMTAFACARVQPAVHMRPRSAHQRSAVATRAVLDSHRVTAPPAANACAAVAVAVATALWLDPLPRPRQPIASDCASPPPQAPDRDPVPLRGPPACSLQ